jgi:hypothetical protein
MAGTLESRIKQNRPGLGWYWEIVSKREVVARGCGHAQASGVTSCGSRANGSAARSCQRAIASCLRRGRRTWELMVACRDYYVLAVYRPASAVPSAPPSAPAARRRGSPRAGGSRRPQRGAGRLQSNNGGDDSKGHASRRPQVADFAHLFRRACIVFHGNSPSKGQQETRAEGRRFLARS